MTASTVAFAGPFERDAAKRDAAWIHSQKERRYFCTVCERTFVERKGTPFYCLHKSVALFVPVIPLLAYGCPPQTIIKAFRRDERTMQHWQQQVEGQCQAVQEHLVVAPQRERGEVQADEIRGRTQGGGAGRRWRYATFRARHAATLQTAMYVGGTVYNFCDEHDSLRVPGGIGGHPWLGRTPAMAAGITNHCWSMQELLSYHVPPRGGRLLSSGGALHERPNS